MKYVGKVGVRVVPDTKRFDVEMRRIESRRPKAFIDLVLDTKDAIAQQRAFAEKWGTREIKQKIRFDREHLEEQIRQLKKGNRFGIDISLRDAEKKLAELKRMTPKDALLIDVRLRKEEAQHDLESLNEEIKRFTNTHRAKLETNAEEAKDRVESLQAQLKRLATDDYRVKVAANFEATEKKVADLRDSLDKVTAPNRRIQIESRLNTETEKAEKLRRELDLLSRQRPRVEIETELTEARRELRRFNAEVQNYSHKRHIVQMGLDVDTANLKRTLKEIENDEKEITFNADLDKGKVWAQLKILTRSRFITLNVRLGKAALARTEAVLKGLTGLNFLEKSKDRILDFVENLDVIAFKVAALAPVFGQLGAMLIGVLPAVLNFLHGFVQVAPITLAAVAAFGALATGVGVTIAAFKNLGDTSVYEAKRFYTAWSNTREEWEALGAVIKEGFFTEQSTRSLEHLTNTVMPQLREGLRDISESLGGTFTGVMDAITVGFSSGQLSYALGQINTSIQNSREGVVGLVQGFMNLGMAGSEFLPGIGSWLNNIGIQFRNWTSDTEHMNSLIKNAATQFGYLKDATVDFFGALGNVMESANLGGEGGFKGLADAMERFRNFTGDPLIQQGLTNMFQSAREGTESLTHALDNSELDMRQMLTNIGELAGGLAESFSGLVRGIVDAFASPGMTRGIKDMTEGVKGFIESIDFTAVGTSVGDVMSLIGELMPYIGPILNKIAVLISKIARKIIEHKEVIGDAFAVIGALIDFLTPVVEFALEGVLRTLEAFMSILKKVINVVGLFVPSLREALEEQGIAELGAEGGRSFADHFRAETKKAEDSADGIPPAVRRHMKKMGYEGERAGTEFSDGLGDGMVKAQDTTASTIEEILRQLEQDTGLQDAGADAGTDYADGFRDGIKGVETVADGIPETVSRATNRMGTLGETSATEFTGGFKQARVEDALGGEATAAARTFADIFREGLKDSASAASELPPAIRDRLTELRDVGQQSAAGFMGGFRESLPPDQLGEIGYQAGSSLAGGFTEGAAPTKTSVEELPPTIQTILGTMRDIGRTGGQEFTGGFVEVMPEAEQAAASLAQHVQTGTADAAAWLQPAGKQAVDGLQLGMAGATGGLSGWVGSTVPSAIAAPLSGASGWLVGEGSNAVGGLQTGMESRIPGLTGRVAVLPDELRAPLRGSDQWFTNEGQRAVRGFTATMDTSFNSQTVPVVRSFPERVRGAYPNADETLRPVAASMMGGFSSKMSAEMASTVLPTARNIPNSISGAVGRPSDTLYGAGSAIMGGLKAGLLSRWGEVMSFVSGIAGWIAANKGPLSYDRTLLRPAGSAIMDGFNKSLVEGFRDTMGIVHDMTTWMNTAAFNDAVFNAPTVTYRSPEVVYGDDFGSLDKLTHITASEASVIARAFAEYLAPDLQEELDILGVKIGAGI